MLIEVYDVGGTWIRGALMMDGFSPIYLKKEKKRTSQDFCSQIIEMSKRLKLGEKSNCISVIVPGPVENGVLLKAPPMSITEPVNLEEKLKPLGENIFIENDLNAAVEAELSYGIGMECKNFYLLTISTGIGAGIVLDGKPVPGKCGEFGHNVLERYWGLAPECGCGNKGCWNSLCSGKGIEMLARKYLKKRLFPEEVFNLVDKGDREAKDLIALIKDYNAHGIGMMVNALEVETIVMMGSVGLNQFDKIIPSKEEISKYTVNPVPKIIPTVLGENIGLLGAYGIACKNMYKK